MPDRAYRLRIRDAADAFNAIVISSVRTDARPYIASVPSGDGQEVDLMTGAVRTGAYTIEVVDVVMGSDATGTLRVMTRELTSGGRQHLLSRRAFLEVSTDGGATWLIVWMAGYLTTIRQVDAITYSITISDSRRIEQNHRAFTWGNNPQNDANSESKLFPKRGCLLGGPIIGGFGPTPDSGGIETELAASESAIWSDNSNRIVALKWLAASDMPPAYTQTRSFVDYALYANKILAPFGVSTTPGSYTDPKFYPLTTPDPFKTPTWFPSLRVYISDSSGNTWLGGLRAFFPWGRYIRNQTSGGGSDPTGLPFQYIYVTLSATQPAVPAVGTKLRVRVVHSVVSEKSPLYFDEHPVDVVTKLYQSVNIPFDTASASAMKLSIGADVRLACRITESQVMSDFLTKAIFGPFGFSARTNSEGKQQFFSTRIGTATPSLTIATNDLVGESLPSGFDVDETTVVTGVNFTYRVLAQAVTDPESDAPPPPDGIVESTHRLENQSGDVSTYSTRVIDYDIPGMVRHKDTWEPRMELLVSGVANEIFDRFGRGAPTYELPVLDTSAAAAAQVGDEVLITAAHVPNQNYRIGESIIGARVAQVVRRDETPIGPVFKLVDSGPDNQLLLGPTVSVVKETLNPRTLASFTITNAATLNGTGVAVEVEYATGASTPAANGMTLTRYETGLIPTGAVLLPAFVPGTRVWVRARSVAPERRPSAWSSWANVALDAWLAPSLVFIGTTSATAVKVSWINGNPYDRVAVYLYAGPANPADWEPYRVATLPPNSTETNFRGLTASTAYRVAVAHDDAGTGAVSSYASNNFTTSGTTTLTAPRVSNMVVIPTIVDAQFQSGIALGLWAGDESLEIEIQRAPNVAGSPGTWATIAIVPGTTTVFGDPLPATGETFWYRSRHIGGGFTAGVYQNNTTPAGLAYAWPWPIVSGVVGSLPASISRPSRVTPSIALNVQRGIPNYSITWTAVGEVEWWYAGAPISPQPSSPYLIPNPGNGINDGPYTVYVYADGNTVTEEFLVTGYSAGEAVPAGGLAGQVLTKDTNANFDAVWATVGTNNGIYNVKEYGALGDDTTNDFTAIQAAVDAALAAGGGIVYFPVGLYRVSQSITLGSNITIRGTGRENTTLRTMNYGSGATFTGTYVLKGTDVENVVIEDIEIRGVSIDGSASTALYLTLLSASNVGHIIVRNVLVNDHAGDGVIINTPILCTFQNVKFRYCAGHGVKVFNGTSTNFYDCYAVTCLKAGFFLDTMVYCAIVGCAADVCGVGYDLVDSSAIAITGSGCESARSLPAYSGWPGISYRTNGSRAALYSCYSRDPDTTGQAGHFTGDWQVHNFRAMQLGVQTLYQLRLFGSQTDANMTIEGDIAFDSSTLYIDASTNRVGVRTTAPTVPLDVTSDSSGVALAVRAGTADTVAGVQFRNVSASVSNGLIQTEKVGTNGGKFTIQTKPDGGALTTRLQVPATAAAGQVYLLVYDVDNATLEQVTVGAADSAGTGFKVLRIPN
jgi:hypothetical protein